MAYKYKVGMSETWSQVAAKFRTTVPQLMGINKGVSALSTGMAIKVPQFQYSAPAAPQTIGATASMGGANPSVSTMQNGFTPSRFGPVPNQPTATTGTTAPKLPAPTVTGRGTGNFNMNYGQNQTPATPPTTTGNIYNNPYTSIMYERDASGRAVIDPATGLPKYNYVIMRQSNGAIIYNSDGTPRVTPSSMYVSDVQRQARDAGMTYDQYTADMRANGYTLFGGKWVYVGGGTPKPTGVGGGTPKPPVKPPRNAHGNLIRRKEADTFTGGAVPGVVSTSSSNLA